MGKIKVNNNGGSGGGNLDLVEIGTHYCYLPVINTIKAYVGTKDVSDLCTYIPDVINIDGASSITVDLGGKLKKTSTFIFEMPQNLFSYSGDYELLSDNKVLLLKTSGTLIMNEHNVFNDYNIVAVGAGASGGVGGYTGGNGGAGGKVVSFEYHVAPNTSSIINVAQNSSSNTICFEQTANSGQGAAGGRGSAGPDGPTVGTNGSLITLGSYSTYLAGGGGGGGGENGSWGAAGGAGGGGRGGNGLDYPTPGNPGTFYGAGGGGAGTRTSSGGAGYQGAVFLYNGYDFIPQ